MESGTSIRPVPKQPRPAKIGKSVRLRPKLLEAVEAKCAEEELNFNEVVERALEAYVGEGKQ